MEFDFRAAPGVPMRYLDEGEGSPVVLVHGSLTDARYWVRSGQLQGLAQSHRVIAPSRLRNYPNPPISDDEDYSARDDAADLIELITVLDVGPVHLLGHSYGGYASLLVATSQHDLVRSLVLAEPPILRWLPHLPDGEGIWESFNEAVWGPLGEAFRESGDAAGLDATARWYFGSSFEDIDPSWQRDFEDSVHEWRALTTSSDAFPFVPFEEVEALKVPTLLLSAGANAGGFNDVIDGALHDMIPGSQRIVVPDVSHEMFLDAPDVTLSHLVRFFGSNH